MAQLPWLHPTHNSFPPPSSALDEPNGLLAAGGSLSVPRLIEAYRQGIFPWYEDGQPILWWSPDPRLILRPSEIHIAKSLAKILRKNTFKVTFDTDFPAVMRACSAPRDGQRGTWITEDMMQAYKAFHDAGYAHSVEVWLDDELVGGLYGVAMGQVFFGESMFSRISNTSKVALATLCDQLTQWGFSLIDCQMETPHLISLGATTISRDRFCNYLAEGVIDTTSSHFLPGKWHRKTLTLATDGTGN